MTSGHNSLSNLNLFRLAFPLSTVTRCSILLRLSLLARLSTGTGRGFLVASFHTALVLSLTFIARRASRFALDPLIYRILPPNKKPRARGAGGGKNAIPESQCCPTKTNANRGSVSGQSFWAIHSFIHGRSLRV